MKQAVIFLVLFISFSGVVFGQGSQDVIDIGDQRQVFFDKYVIGSLSGSAKLEMHKPIDRGAVLNYDKEWEGKFCGYFTVIKDGDKYRLYYRGSSSVPADYPKTLPGEYTCYAESSDGVSWVRPKLGIYEFKGSKDNNIILGNRADRICHNFSPFIDKREGVKADERYKAVGGTWRKDFEPKKRLVAYCSADGIHWKAMSDKPVFEKVGWYLDSQNVAFWSEAENCYVLFYRSAPKNKRSVGKAVSSDFIGWKDLGNMKYSDTGAEVPSCQFYTSQTHPYYRSEQVYIATAARFFEGRQVLTEKQAKEIGVDARYFKDTSDSGFMTTRPGSMVYDRNFMSALIAPGIGAENWVSRSNYPALNIVQTSDTEMSLYVSQNNAQDTAHLRRYTFRIDGIASVRAEHQGGELITKPLKFSGDQLSLNFATSAAGSIKVEIQDVDGKAIDGFALKDGRELIGNEIERVYDWNSKTNLKELEGKVIQLRFVMKDADLYSFVFKKSN